MSIVDKLTFEETDLSKSLLRTGSLAGLPAQIIGDEAAANLPTSSCDELAAAHRAGAVISDPVFTGNQLRVSLSRNSR